MDGVIEGRIVHYVLPEGPHEGEHRPAIIVKVWTGGYVNLQVFYDGTNDGPVVSGQPWVTSVEHSEDPRPRTWHWIERA
jgi:hypothetical protein